MPDIDNSTGRGPTPTPDPISEIDLNQEDLSALRAQMRASYPTTIMSERVLDAILALRRSGETIYEVSDLEAISGVGPSLVRAMSKNCRAALKPLDQPVRIIFWSHPEDEDPTKASQKDRDAWQSVVARLSKEVAELEPHRPVTILLEEGVQELFSYGTDEELRAALGLAALSGEDGISKVMLAHLTGERVLPRLDVLLRRHYAEFLRFVKRDETNNSDEYLKAHDLNGELRSLILTMGDSHRISIVAERPPFESCLKLMQATEYRNLISKFILSGDISEALDALAKYTLTFMEGAGRLRDVSLTSQIKENLRAKPNSAIFVIRGSAHQYHLPFELEQAGLGYTQFIADESQWEPIWEWHAAGKPPFDSPQGILHLKRDLLSLLLTSQVDGTFEPLAELKLRNLTEAQFDDWASSVGRDASMNWEQKCAKTAQLMGLRD